MTGSDSSLPCLKGGSDYCQTVRIRQLVLAAQSGCAASFAEIRDLYWRRLFATVISITRNPEDAEDALQDTFLKAFIALKGFQWRSAFYTWLTQITINSALMLLRRSRRRLETSFTVMAEDSSEGSQSRDLDFEDPTASPEEVCSQRQRLLRLNAAIGRLDPRLRTVLETHIREECSLRDVARTLNITEAAVKSRLYRARRRLSLARVVGRRRTTGQPRPEVKSSALRVM
jgi:RNA polymerase sigma-70 factor (ECF subfamily)